jgi:prepilin-type N-terminal cleavage/methylation domain
MISSKRKKDQAGFTLIELVSVVIILGILAAVIVPKYFDMTSKAQDAAYKGALNEGVARFNMAYAQYILETNVKPTNVASLTGYTSTVSNSTLLSTPQDLGDYTVAYSGGGTGVNTVIKLYKSTNNSTELKYSSGSNAELSAAWPN